jgi:hypothetical protein
LNIKQIYNLFKTSFYQRNLKTLAILTLLFLVLAPAEHCYANPIDPNFPITTSEPARIILIFLCPIIEAGIITFVLRHYFINTKWKVSTFIIIFFFNIITVVITWGIGNELLYSDVHNTVYFAEFFPLIFEPLILLLYFWILFKTGKLTERLKVKYVVLLVIGVNVLTFLLGLIFFRYWPTPFKLVDI